MTGVGLELEGIVKRFGDLLAVDGVSFDVQPGEVFGFVGTNGAGKTTTMRVLLGVLAADAGEARWAGRRLDFETRRRIGYMPEERGLYPRMPIKEQLVYLAQLHGSDPASADTAAARWLDRFGLTDRSRDDLLKLSHGNQQRVQLAAALAFDPIMLVLDEPFAGLDPEAVDAMSDVLHEQAKAGTPVLFSSHQLELVERLCHRVGIIRRGRMVACGTVDELRAGGPRRYWVDVGSPGVVWAAGLRGARIVATEDSSALVELDEGTDEQVVLRAALSAGPVREFRRERPTLLDIFRDAMREPDAA